MASVDDEPHQDDASNAGHALVADSDNNDDDLALHESINASYSSSLASEISEYRYENGRRYHAYRDGAYPLPNDEKEQDRLDMFHHFFRMLIGGALYRAPIDQGQSPSRVLDLGTGTGIWAMDFADEFSDAMVIGTDLSPVQPKFVPVNCKFYVDDFECSWEFDQNFDYIHGRGICGSVADWPKFFAQAYQNMKPGGWLEMQEYQTWIFSDDDTIDRAPWVREWNTGVDEASIKFGKRFRTAQQHKQWMQEAGFIDVREEIYKAPIGPWAKGKKFKELGTWYRATLLEAVEPFVLGLYTRFLGYTAEQARVVVAETRRELLDPQLHLYVPFHFVYGRKPENS